MLLAMSCISGSVSSSSQDMSRWGGKVWLPGVGVGVWFPSVGISVWFSGVRISKMGRCWLGSMVWFPGVRFSGVMVWL